MSIHIAFKIGVRSTSVLFEIFSASVFHVGDHPMATGSMRGVGIADEQTMRTIGWSVDAEGTVKVSHASSQDAIDLFRVYTPKSKTTLLSLSTSITFSNSA